MVIIIFNLIVHQFGIVQKTERSNQWAVKKRHSPAEYVSIAMASEYSLKYISIVPSHEEIAVLIFLRKKQSQGIDEYKENEKNSQYHMKND